VSEGRGALLQMPRRSTNYQGVITKLETSKHVEETFTNAKDKNIIHHVRSNHQKCFPQSSNKSKQAGKNSCRPNKTKLKRFRRTLTTGQAIKQKANKVSK
jgi:hypothetical protein